MMSSKNVWVLVLAGGEGKRLRVLTTEPCGTPVPKQFCSLRGERSLIEEAIDRGGRSGSYGANLRDCCCGA
jgi:mannose-1-phosphate guanylyltransferase